MRDTGFDSHFFVTILVLWDRVVSELELIRKVVQVHPVKCFKVYVYFDDGVIKLYDVQPLIAKGGVFQQISAESDFVEKCTVLNGTLAWDLSGRYDPTQCIDIDPETIYKDGIDSKDPLEEGVGECRLSRS